MLVVSAAYASGMSIPNDQPSLRPVSLASTDVRSPALPRGGDLTFGESAGQVLIGLTVRPAEPGPNTLVLYVMPVDGPSSAADVPVNLSVGGQNIELETCSRTCRTTTMNLNGGERLDITTGGRNGGSASFELPALPAQDATALVEQLQQRMHQLHTYRVEETLGPATPLLRASYVFEAPDRMQLTPANGETTVWIGPTRYTRPVNSTTWQVEDFGSSLPVPSFVWDSPGSGSSYVGAHIVGNESVDGIPTQILTFFVDLPQTPVWFRLSVDAGGLVRRASMRAQGHFMDQVYTDFDAPLWVEPPP
jgi:hypothetical protein